VAHANAVLTPVGRRLLVDRVLSGRPQSHVAKELGVSRQCVARWVSRFQSEGVAGLEDRSSRPTRSPTHTPAPVRELLLEARARERLDCHGVFGQWALLLNCDVLRREWSELALPDRVRVMWEQRFPELALVVAP
jgi:transposase